jgi:hypothetical protein
MAEDLDDIIGKLNDQGGFGALLLDDTIKTKLEYLSLVRQNTILTLVPILGVV